MDGHTDDSSDDDREDYLKHDFASLTSPDGKDAFRCLYAKFFQLIRQCGPGFADFLPPLTLENDYKDRALPGPGVLSGRSAMRPNSMLPK